MRWLVYNVIPHPEYEGVYVADGDHGRRTYRAGSVEDARDAYLRGRPENVERESKDWTREFR